MNSELENDKTEFINWLIKSKKFGKKVSQDYYYRVLRVEKQVFSSIEKTLTTKNDFLSLSKKIEKYSNFTHQNQKKANTLSGTLRSSVKKYGEYKNPLMSNFYSKPFVFKNSDNSLRIAQD